MAHGIEEININDSMMGLFTAVNCLAVEKVMSSLTAVRYYLST